MTNLNENDHSHCGNCIKIEKCLSKLKKQPCPIINCPSKCGFKLHSCKLNDHRIICMNEKIQCINNIYGCPIWLKRKNLSTHISCCPASVVHCTVEWNRWPIHTRDRRLTRPIISDSLDISRLDVALTLRDQRMLGDLWTATRKTRSNFRNSLTRKYPAVPFKPYHGLHGNEHHETSSPTCPSVVSDDDSDSSLLQMNKLLPGLQSSVCAKLNGTSLNVEESPKKINSCGILNGIEKNCNTASIPPPPALPNCTSLSLDLNLDALPPFQPKPKLMYTFRCAQEFRRDEFRSHYKNIHGDIHGSIDGWMEHRCPLWRYGCNYVQRRIHPFPIGTKIIFNPIIESFGHVMNTTCEKSESNYINLSFLPYEILRHICKHLDGFSLNNLSMTCVRLRDVCSTFLEMKGIVILQWERTTDSEGVHHWVVGYKRWIFSTNFNEIKNWYIDDNHGVLNHIKSCPHYERMPYTSEPILLPIRQKNLDTKKLSKIRFNSDIN